LCDITQGKQAMSAMEQSSPAMCAPVLGEVLQNRAAFENSQWRATSRRLSIDDCGNASVRIDAHERRRELLAATDVHRNDSVGQPAFFEQEGTFQLVGVGQ